MRTGRIRGRKEKHIDSDVELTGAHVADRSGRREVADDIGGNTVHTVLTTAATAELQRRQGRGRRRRHRRNWAWCGAADQPLAAIIIQYLQGQRDLGEDTLLYARVGLS